MPQVPPYPPEQVWSFPPPPVGRHWLWVAVVGAIVSSLLIVGLIATAVVLESDDAAGLIENGPLLAAIGEECDSMTTRVEQLAAEDRPGQLASTIRDQNEAVAAMVEQIRSTPRSVLADDQPAEAWLRDWTRLVDARESYAKNLEGKGETASRFQTPLDPDGEPISTRMDDALLEDVCQVPATLTDPGRRARSTV